MRARLAVLVIACLIVCGCSSCKPPCNPDTFRAGCQGKGSYAVCAGMKSLKRPQLYPTVWVHNCQPDETCVEASGDSGPDFRCVADPPQRCTGPVGPRLGIEPRFRCMAGRRQACTRVGPSDGSVRYWVWLGGPSLTDCPADGSLPFGMPPDKFDGFFTPVPTPSPQSRPGARSR